MLARAKRSVGQVPVIGALLLVASLLALLTRPLAAEVRVLVSVSAQLSACLLFSLVSSRKVLSSR
jgi:hypothetical protein